MDERIRPIDDVTEIPINLSDEEMIDFLDEHGVSEEFLENTPEAPEEERPIPRTRPINVRFDNFTLTRLKEMADRKHVGYQTLLKTFVAERLYEEEKREGLPTADPEVGAQASPEAEEQRSEPKKRDWQQQAFDFIKENKGVIEDENLDLIASARVLGDGSSLLLAISNDVKAASKKERYPAARLNRMMKGYYRLKDFIDRAFAIHEAKFGLPEPEESGGRGETVVSEEENVFEEGSETLNEEDEQEEEEEEGSATVDALEEEVEVYETLDKDDEAPEEHDAIEADAAEDRGGTVTDIREAMRKRDQAKVDVEPLGDDKGAM